MKISRTVFNYWLDMLLLVLLLVLVWASIIVRFIFPSPAASDGWTLWGWDYHQWTDFRMGALALLVLGVLLHLMMHWNWICMVTVARILGHKGRKLSEGEETLYGVGVLVLIVNVVGLALAAAVLMIQGP